MRWIVTTDYHGGCIGLGEDANGVPARGAPEKDDALAMEFRLYEASGNLLFEGRCGDIDADWWNGFEPLVYVWTPFRCRRLSYRRAGTGQPWRWLRDSTTKGNIAAADPAGSTAVAPKGPHEENRARRAPPGSHKESVDPVTT